MTTQHAQPILRSHGRPGKRMDILEIAAQGIAQCEVSATRVVVDAALRRIGKSRHGCHKNANISGDCEGILKRISPMD